MCITNATVADGRETSRRGSAEQLTTWKLLCDWCVFVQAASLKSDLATSEKEFFVRFQIPRKTWEHLKLLFYTSNLFERFSILLCSSVSSHWVTERSAIFSLNNDRYLVISLLNMCCASRRCCIVVASYTIVSPKLLWSLHWSSSHWPVEQALSFRF